MKNLKFGFLATLLVASMAFTTGCKDDPCKDVVCQNGECVEGDCVCDAGYEGVSCETALNAKFSGSYSLTETCSASGAAGPYSVTIAPKSATTSQATFVGLWEVPANIVTGDIGTDGVSFSIARQQIMTGFDIEATGGTITADGNTINLTYKIYATGSSTVSDQCTATISK